MDITERATHRTVADQARLGRSSESGPVLRNLYRVRPQAPELAIQTIFAPVRPIPSACLVRFAQRAEGAQTPLPSETWQLAGT